MSWHSVGLDPLGDIKITITDTSNILQLVILYELSRWILTTFQCRSNPLGTWFKLPGKTSTMDLLSLFTWVRSFQTKEKTCEWTSVCLFQESWVWCVALPWHVALREFSPKRRIAWMPSLQRGSHQKTSTWTTILEQWKQDQTHTRKNFTNLIKNLRYKV